MFLKLTTFTCKRRTIKGEKGKKSWSPSGTECFDSFMMLADTLDEADLKLQGDVPTVQGPWPDVATASRQAKSQFSDGGIG